MKYQAIQLSGSRIKKGFDSNNEAWDWIMNNVLCESCKELYDKGEIEMCSAEWTVDEEDG